jgi:GT2 family glycosyltransferase
MADQVTSLRREVIVVDNASYDGAEAMIAESFPAVKFVQLGKNLGFAQANNIAYGLSQGNILLFLNPDTEVIGDSIEVLYQHVQSLPGAGAAGCKLLNSDGSVQTSCIQRMPTILNQLLDSNFLRRLLPRSRLWGTEALHNGTETAQRVEMVSGACLMAKKEAFEAAGQFSSDYFMYAEDVDLCYNIQKAGYGVYFVPKATVIHHGGKSSSGSFFSAVIMRESIWKLLRKTRGLWYSNAYRASLVLVGVLRLGLLGLGMPIVLLVKGFTCWRWSVLKWLAIIQWGVGAGRESNAPRTAANNLS